MQHSMRLQSEPFDMIKSGQKTVEMRLFDEKRSMIKVGDTIAFSHYGCDEEVIFCRVTALYRFDSFAELYAVLPLTSLGYTAETAKTATYLDMEKYYSPEEQSRYGVVGIGIELTEAGI